MENKEKYRNFLICLVDTISLLVSTIAANYVWVYFYRGEDVRFDNTGILLLTFMAVFFLTSSNKNFFERSKTEEFLDIVRNIFLLAVFYILILYTMKKLEGASRGSFICTFAFFLLLDFGAHLILKTILVKYYKKNYTKLILVTVENRAEKVIRELNGLVTGVILINETGQGKQIDGVPVVANLENMLDYVKREIVDEVFIDIPIQNNYFLKLYIKEFEKMGITVHINIEVLGKFEKYNKHVEMMGGYPVITFANNFYDEEKLMVKRMMDIVGGIVGGLITVMVMIILFPIIKLDSPGPVLFKQKRVGKNGRYFYIYKFRSMYQDAEKRKQELMSKNEMSGLMFKMKDDPRITRVGKFIRATSIDELPQFFNVLKGDMSLVGTRPPTVDEFRQYKMYHKRRLSIKPGITGMWQVSGRSDIEDFEEVVRLDLYYIDNWSLLLDVKILLKTVGAVFKRTGSR